MIVNCPRCGTGHTAKGLGKLGELDKLLGQLEDDAAEARR